MSWPDARQVCRASSGGDLATIVDASELTSIITASSFQHKYAWIGLNDMAQQGSFVWANGVSSDYRPWFPGEPNDSGGNEGCAHIMRVERALNDNNCNAEMYFVCEVINFTAFSCLLSLVMVTVSKPNNESASIEETWQCFARLHLSYYLDLCTSHCMYPKCFVYLSYMCACMYTRCRYKNHLNQLQSLWVPRLRMYIALQRLLHKHNHSIV